QPLVHGWMGVCRYGSAVRVTYARKPSWHTLLPLAGKCGDVLVVCDWLTTRQAHKHQRPPRRVAVFTIHYAYGAALSGGYTILPLERHLALLLPHDRANQESGGALQRIFQLLRHKNNHPLPPYTLPTAREHRHSLHHAQPCAEACNQVGSVLPPGSGQRRE